MAAHYRDNILHGRDHSDTHADAGKWRHQESKAYAEHPTSQDGVANDRGGVSDLADFFNSSRLEPQGGTSKALDQRYKPIVVEGNGSAYGHSGENGNANITDGANEIKAEHEDAADQGAGAQNYNNGSWNAPEGSHPRIIDGREVRCGPLLNYRRMDNGTWFGSVLIVTRGGGATEGNFKPHLLLKRSEGITHGVTLNHDGSNENGQYHAANSTVPSSHASQDALTSLANEQFATKNSLAGEAGETIVPGVRLYSDPENTFWRFSLHITIDEVETKWIYRIPGLRFPDKKKTDQQSFFVPALNESMRIMFHSCNGFSVGTDEEAYSGPCLWNDVLRVHQKTPFHVMLGGGDQIYNDGIRVHGPLRPWTDIGNPSKRRNYPFPETLRKECDAYYVANYIRWYSTEPFSSVNGQVPQINLWDDHDIIDGFGSYTDHFMKCDVFRGIGGVAHKYYLLFQHHLAPPRSTYTTDAPQTMAAGPNGVGADPEQLKDTYVLENEPGDPCYIIGHKPGPYVAEHSRSIYARLGARVAFFGIDARTERTRHQVNYPETYDLIFDRLKSELSAATSSSSPIKHLVVLLGIPIAYPRLTWLENIFGSPLLGPIKILHKRFGFGGGFFNHFDGSVDLLDDLDDHYTATAHKRERYGLVMRLQELAVKFSVRITILGGDVHLAALGRFYSNPELNIPTIHDHRYMANVISSAIVNKPPPAAVANLLARRNKIHHLDENTDETLLKLFDKDPSKGQKTASHNHVTMPARNWAMITENSPRTSEISLDDEAVKGCTGKDGHFPIGPGEVTAGSQSRAANESHGTAGDGSLDICIRVEKDQHDARGFTQSYGVWVPLLILDQEMSEKVMRKRDAIQGAVAARV